MDDTIVAVSTPIGEGGIGIVRLSGSKALAIADKIFVSKDGKKASRFKTHTVHYGHIVNSPQSIVDEVLLTVMRAPRTYTKEDIVEINCHGGIQAMKQVLELAVAKGARQAEPGEFTKRAFLNGRIDLVQAEAVLDVIRARTEGSLKAAMGQLDGELSKKVGSIYEVLLGAASSVEASIDFPEEELDIAGEGQLIERIEGAIGATKHIIETYDDGAVLREGVLAIICGKPNVGKSSLMNLLLKRDRVIVSHVPGTTRDAVEEMISLRGIPIRLVDTAGIVRTKDIVEKEGVKRAKRYLDRADIALFMLDGSSEIEKKDLDIAKLLKAKKKLIIINKADLGVKTGAEKAKDIFKEENVVEISVERKKNIGALEKMMIDMVWSGSFIQSEGAFVTNIRHKELLDKAYANMLSIKNALKEKVSAELISIDIKEAIFSLGLIIGKSVSDDVLDRIFEQFCIGK